MYKKCELLAPAGSALSLKAAINAGADAVYMGGPAFSARAYADNPSVDEYLSALDFAHIRDKKVYLTINTLFKEREIEEKLYDYLLPFYKNGIDAVLIQDLGVLSFVRRNFPGLITHISTQMTVTGAYSAEYFKNLGAKRVVPARELSFEEIKKIAATGIEVECFVHGAMCYSYSGKCLFSSLAGGRSGNRGRCAQPCRQCYDLFAPAGKKLNRAGERYLLSMKDMNALSLLPQILDVGVCSLKIEGRMKKPEYIAGVTSIYRKYLDMAEEILSGDASLGSADKKYIVLKDDEDKLFDLFNRNGFSKGYYGQRNGRDMMSLKETAFRSHDESFIGQINDDYIKKDIRRNVQMEIVMKQGQNIKVLVYDDENRLDLSYSAPDAATIRPLLTGDVKKQFSKSGGTDFNVTDISLDMDNDIFVPVSVMNSMRREALDRFKKLLLEKYRKNAPQKEEESREKDRYAKEEISGIEKRVSVKVTSYDQLKVCLDSGLFDRVYLSPFTVPVNDLKAACEKIKASGAECFYSFPEPLRYNDEIFYEKNIAALKNAGLCGFLCDSAESLCFVKKHFENAYIVADQGLYTWNKEAAVSLKDMCAELTCPAELNERELKERGMLSSELVVYGYLPMMISAGCVFKNTAGCLKAAPGNNIAVLKDDKKHEFKVLAECSSCRNIIYNCVPLVLFDDEKLLSRILADHLRLSFTVENEKETWAVIESFKKKKYDLPFTRGHVTRGVE
ncbi:MAG: U32 family peptidase [Lachnospiraceae bacterium]|nr:U32 family peptidase [Lachnospiraceae bacterium]